MDLSRPHVVIIATGQEALTAICGISVLERLLRTLQRLGLGEATVLTRDVAAVSAHVAERSWPRAEIAVTVQEPGEPLAQQRPAKTLLMAAACYDSRLLAALLAQERTTVLVDSAPPPALQRLIASAEHGAAGYFCRAALLDNESLGLREHIDSSFELLASAAERGAVAVLDVNLQPGYIVDLRRVVRPFWFPAPASELVPDAERLLLDAAQNGTLDLPANLHAPIETWIIARLCKTKITPMQITLFTAAVSAVVTMLFASGHLVAGTLLAIAVGILDGLDGKQARVKVETTELGKREHVFDYVLELSWWTALAYHFGSIGAVPHAHGFLLLLVGSDVVDRLGKGVAKNRTGRNLDDVAPIDRFVRLIGGRRNIYIWILAVGLALGAADGAFVTLCHWAAATAAVHVLRALWIVQRRAESEGIAH